MCLDPVLECWQSFLFQFFVLLRALLLPRTAADEKHSVSEGTALSLEHRYKRDIRSIQQSPIVKHEH